MRQETRDLILEEIALKQATTGTQEQLYPILVIANNARDYLALSEVRDYLWFDEVPERYEGVEDFYKLGV